MSRYLIFDIEQVQLCLQTMLTARDPDPHDKGACRVMFPEVMRVPDGYRFAQVRREDLDRLEDLMVQHMMGQIRRVPPDAPYTVDDLDALIDRTGVEDTVGELVHLAVDMADAGLAEPPDPHTPEDATFTHDSAHHAARWATDWLDDHIHEHPENHVLAGPAHDARSPFTFGPRATMCAIGQTIPE